MSLPVFLEYRCRAAIHGNRVLSSTYIVSCMARYHSCFEKHRVGLLSRKRGAVFGVRDCAESWESAPATRYLMLRSAVTLNL